MRLIRHSYLRTASPHHATLRRLAILDCHTVQSCMTSGLYAAHSIKWPQSRWCGGQRVIRFAGSSSRDGSICTGTTWCGTHFSVVPQTAQCGADFRCRFSRAGHLGERRAVERRLRCRSIMDHPGICGRTRPRTSDGPHPSRTDLMRAIPAPSGAGASPCRPDRAGRPAGVHGRRTP